MSIHDPISDLLTRLRNGAAAHHRYVDAPLSKMALAIVQILRQRGFIAHYLTANHKMRLFLKYDHQRRSLLRGLKRCSKLGCRHYIGYRQIAPVLSGMGIAILSTSKGVMEGQAALRAQVGGELICQVW